MNFLAIYALLYTPYLWERIIIVRKFDMEIVLLIYTSPCRSRLRIIGFWNAICTHARARARTHAKVSLEPILSDGFYLYSLFSSLSIIGPSLVNVNISVTKIEVLHKGFTPRNGPFSHKQLKRFYLLYFATVWTPSPWIILCGSCRQRWS
jgi:hypothetical protein